MVGFSTEEYLMDDSLTGMWQINATYFGNKSMAPTHLKVTIYHNYGTLLQRKEIKVFKLDLREVNRKLFTLSNTSFATSK